jgi:hypothetical protein
MMHELAASLAECSHLIAQPNVRLLSLNFPEWLEVRNTEVPNQQSSLSQ